MSLNHTKAGLGVLAPLVTALSAWLTASVAKYGVHVDASGVNAALVSGATCGIAVMVKLIHDVEKDDPEIKAVAGDADAISSAIEQADPQIRQVVRHAIEEEILNLTHRIGQATAMSNGESVPVPHAEELPLAEELLPPAEELLPPAEELPSAEEPQSVEEHPPTTDPSPAEPSLVEEPQSTGEHPPTTDPSPAEPSLVEEQSAPLGSTRSVRIPRLG
jgi:hypothetical protein